MVGKSFEMTLTNKGKVTSISGFDVIIRDLFENLPKSVESQKEQLSTQMEKAFGKDSFIQSMEAATAIFPEKPVRIGDTWMIETTVMSTMEYSISNVYTLKKVTDELYVVIAKGTITSPENADFMETNGVLMKQELSGTSTSKISLVKSTGWVQNSEFKQNISGKTIMKQTADGEVMEMPMTLKATTLVTDKN